MLMFLGEFLKFFDDGEIQRQALRETLNVKIYIKNRGDKPVALAKNVYLRG
jgi:hypothetical protein